MTLLQRLPLTSTSLTTAIGGLAGVGLFSFLCEDLHLLVHILKLIAQLRPTIVIRLHAA